MAQLEDGLIAYASGDLPRDGLITEMQAIDQTQQTLEDLARMLDVLAATPTGAVGPPDCALAAIRQSALRERLSDMVGGTGGKRNAMGQEGKTTPQEENVELW
ncbi:hypothetical protein [Jannaschia formosa]|uniref:hypothetical protein n=1 Tax=Jannaschia formosa TaxID=2259592 RepID=UPI00107529A9|nr:hypothetical protein [Jannaschia formosa]TFL16717.1 hypothetical protein DR046_18235 [Jannaschia formosa]